MKRTAIGIVLLFAATSTPHAQSQSLPCGDRELSMGLASAADTASKLPTLHSLLVQWQGQLLLERYYRGKRASSLANIKSASKSVISALVGIAIDRGSIRSVSQEIGAFFPEILTDPRSLAKRSITIENLLTMQAGLESTSSRNYGAWVLSPNWIRYALERPLASPPGTRMQYSTGNTHLLSAILTKASKVSTWKLAQDSLARPLGFSLAPWSKDPQGVYFGGNDMLMTPRQMLQFGDLYLNDGRSRDGKQVVPASWVRASLTPRVESGREPGRYYGYGWWVRDLGGHQAFYAWGYGGQFIFVIPSLKLGVVTTSASEARSERRTHLRAIYDLVERHIVGPVAAASSGSCN